MTERWAIVSSEGVVLSVAPTEGQAWLALFDCIGRGINGWALMRMVRRCRELEIRALEIEEAYVAGRD